MPKRKHTAEEIINKLREAEVIIATGSTVAEAVRRIGVSGQTCYRWRAEYGGLRVDQARRLKQLETENSRLRTAGSSGRWQNSPWTTSYSRRQLRETAEPRSPPRVCRARQVGSGSIRSSESVLASGLPGVGAAPTQRHEPLVRDDEQALTDDIVGLASQSGRYG